MIDLEDTQPDPFGILAEQKESEAFREPYPVGDRRKSVGATVTHQEIVDTICNRITALELRTAALHESHEISRKDAEEFRQRCTEQLDQATTRMDVSIDLANDSRRLIQASHDRMGTMIAILDRVTSVHIKRA